MRIIPVLDLKGGVAVHAVRGQRQEYGPLQSCLCPRPDPLQVARAYQLELGLTECYVADLDAIAGAGDHRELVRSLVGLGMRVMVDAGVNTPAAAGHWLATGVAQVVVGTETLESLAELRDILTAAGPARAILSLDMRGGVVVSRAPELAGAPPLKALGELVVAGASEVILLDLDRVGTGSGPVADLLQLAKAGWPGVQLLAGGGVRHVDDLAGLQAAGAAGALVGTALHTGALTSTEIRPWAWFARRERRPNAARGR